MSIVKSNLLKQLSQQYKNYLKKDLSKTSEIILQEIKNALKNGESVELRGFGRFSTKIQKKKWLEIQKLARKYLFLKKKVLTLKLLKKLLKK